MTVELNEEREVMCLSATQSGADLTDTGKKKLQNDGI